MTAKDATRIVTKIFLRYPGSRPPEDQRAGILAVWVEEFGEWFAADDAQDVERWAVQACRERRGQFVPALDDLVSGMTAEKREEKRTRERALRLEEAPISLLSDSEVEENKAKLRALMAGIGMGLN